MKVERPEWVRVELKYPAKNLVGTRDMYKKYMEWLDSNNIPRYNATKGFGFADHVNLLPEDAVAFKLVFGL
jgi:hypothetical protein